MKFVSDSVVQSCQMSPPCEYFDSGTSTSVASAYDEHGDPLLAAFGESFRLLPRPPPHTPPPPHTTHHATAGAANDVSPRSPRDRGVP